MVELLPNEPEGLPIEEVVQGAEGSLMVVRVVEGVALGTAEKEILQLLVVGNRDEEVLPRDSTHLSLDGFERVQGEVFQDLKGRDHVELPILKGESLYLPIELLGGDHFESRLGSVDPNEPAKPSFLGQPVQKEPTTASKIEKVRDTLGNQGGGVVDSPDLIAMDPLPLPMVRILEDSLLGFPDRSRCAHSSRFLPS